jgi:hypothetical protein
MLSALNDRRNDMKSTRFGLILAGIGLPLMLSVVTLVRADDKATSEAEATAAVPASAPAASVGNSTPATADATVTGEAKPGRLRFRSATSSGCTSAKGGVSDADIRRAEKERESAKN